jgi:hypothetical protein
MPPPVIEATLASPLATPAVPKYLDQVYWWAYVHPKAVQVFERDWLVNTILFGHYALLRDAALPNSAKRSRAARCRSRACTAT